MQNDLISRNAFIERLSECKEIYGMPITKYDEQVIAFIIELLKDEPVAYDVEKVVAKFEEKINVINNQIDRDSVWGLLGVREGYRDAIDMVKGGVEDAE